MPADGAPSAVALARSHPLLAALDPPALAGLLAASELWSFAEDDVVLQAEQSNDRIFLVVGGVFHAILDPARPRSRVPIDTGECFGEMSLIEQKPISATVVAGNGARAIAIPESALWSTIALDPTLARSLLRTMSERMRRRSDFVIEATRERLTLEAMQRELALAKEVQLSMLADGDSLLAEQPLVDAAASMEPANGVGGDFFDAFAVDAERVFLAVGDVAGKGISAAIFMARSLATLRLEVLSGKPHETLLERVNQALCEHNAHATFVTLFAGFIDVRQRRLSYFCAGHAAPLLVHGDGSIETLTRPDGFVVGALPEPPYAMAHRLLVPGDILIAYSDGVTEAQNASQEFFGESRLLAALRDSRPDCAAAVLNALRASLASFTGDAPRFDDTTILAVRVLDAAE